MIRILSSSRLHLAWEDPLVHLLLDWLQLKQERLPSLVRRTCTNIMISFLRQISFLWFHQQLSNNCPKYLVVKMMVFHNIQIEKIAQTFKSRAEWLIYCNLNVSLVSKKPRSSRKTRLYRWEKKDTYDLCCWDMYVRKERMCSCNLCCCDMHWKFSGRLARLVSSRTGFGVS